jgi:type II secretory pathway pseudopilin PulG
MLTGIASIVVTLLAAIYTAVILPTLQQYLSARATQLAKQREETEAEQAKINLTYLNPLRLWLEETYALCELQ